MPHSKGEHASDSSSTGSSSAATVKKKVTVTTTKRTNKYEIVEEDGKEVKKLIDSSAKQDVMQEEYEEDLKDKHGKKGLPPGGSKSSTKPEKSKSHSSMKSSHSSRSSAVSEKEDHAPKSKPSTASAVSSSPASAVSSTSSAPSAAPSTDEGEEAAPASKDSKDSKAGEQPTKKRRIVTEVIKTVDRVVEERRRHDIFGEDMGEDMHPKGAPKTPEERDEKIKALLSTQQNASVISDTATKTEVKDDKKYTTTSTTTVETYLLPTDSYRAKLAKEGKTPTLVADSALPKAAEAGEEPGEGEEGAHGEPKGKVILVEETVTEEERRKIFGEDLLNKDGTVKGAPKNAQERDEKVKALLSSPQNSSVISDKATKTEVKGGKKYTTTATTTVETYLLPTDKYREEMAKQGKTPQYHGGVLPASTPEEEKKEIFGEDIGEDGKPKGAPKTDKEREDKVKQLLSKGGQSDMSEDRKVTSEIKHGKKYTTTTYTTVEAYLTPTDQSRHETEKKDKAKAGQKEEKEADDGGGSAKKDDHHKKKGHHKEGHKDGSKGKSGSHHKHKHGGKAKEGVPH